MTDQRGSYALIRPTCSPFSRPCRRPSYCAYFQHITMNRLPKFVAHDPIAGYHIHLTWTLYFIAATRSIGITKIGKPGKSVCCKLQLAIWKTAIQRRSLLELRQIQADEETSYSCIPTTIKSSKPSGSPGRSTLVHHHMLQEHQEKSASSTCRCGGRNSFACSWPRTMSPSWHRTSDVRIFEISNRIE